MVNKNKKSIAIIPARGGSKRLPKKNIRELGGKPLIAYSIEYALENQDIIDQVYVSTDDPDIKNIALQYGATVVDRPQALSGDLEPTVTALKHVLQSIDGKVENVILLQPTNPLRPQNLLKDCFSDFENGNYESAMAVSRNHQKFGKIVNGNFEPFNYSFGQRSQDLEPLYFENGLLYIAKAELILNEKLVGDKNLPFIINHPFAHIDIDTEEDLMQAEFFHSRYFKKY
ncbi:acylneuraminate cytidylyltransferase family protein [Aequorivita echinoideorum]|uniref:Acylneuraminate cytidylyltransferase family protein n=1 Tax=Aequorivita echinoideorum TaxID=1549647 RepID=A0ABS5S5J4_9FLAO|nr:acylneuraminate cytidylyltransferase family protein [Aequorivita echinoideorum]MBT0608454.1 acylneuraminate cytidylyltransferase family protein [Aequorivita echinoideorum]